MSNKIVLRPVDSTTNRREPLLQSSQSAKYGVGEVVGGTVAECVAVCCCCPCGLVNFLVLAIYKLPAGLCRRVLKKRRRRRLLKEGMLQPIKHRHCCCDCCDVNGLRIHPMCANDASDIKTFDSTVEPDVDAMALEKEMWERFYNTGFWRSSSRRESSPPKFVDSPQPLVFDKEPDSRGTSGCGKLNIFTSIATKPCRFS